MSKETIAIDIDDVLAVHLPTMVAFANERYGLRLTEDDYNKVIAPYRGFWGRVWNTDLQETRRRQEEFISTVRVADYGVVEGAVAAIKTLKKRYNLVIVSSRNEKLIVDTHGWLERHFPSAFHGVEFISHWDISDENNKGKLAKKLGASYLIDDSLDHCLDAVEAGLEALLFGNFGWNHAKSLPKGITRVKDWPTVEEYFARVS